MATLRIESDVSAGEARVSAPVTQDNFVQPWETQEFPGLGSVLSVRGEVDDALCDMRLFYKQEPDVVIHVISAHAARIAEIVTHCRRIEVRHKQWKQVREEAEFILRELKDQYQMHSRLLTVRQLDFATSGGQP